MRIKQFFTLLLTALLSIHLFSCSCKDNKKDETEANEWDIPEVIDTIVDLPRTVVHDTISLKKTVYHYEYDFHAVDSLPTVMSFSGLEYHDNGVELTLHSDSSKIFHKSFTKQSFKDFVPSKDLKKMSLTNFNYFSAKRNDPSKFHFLATISDPEESEAYGYYIDVQISKSGDLHLEKAQEKDITTMPLNYDEEADV